MEEDENGDICQDGKGWSFGLQASPLFPLQRIV